MSRSWFFFIVVVVGVTLALFGVRSLRPVTVSSTEVLQANLGFLATTLGASGPNAQHVPANRSAVALDCDAAGQCKQLILETKAPMVAWEMLAALAAFRAGHDNAALQKVYDRFRQLGRLRRGDEGLWSLHQLYSAYEETGDNGILGYFLGRVLELLRDRQSRGVRMGEFGQGMLAATVARQFALGALAIRVSPESRRLLSTAAERTVLRTSDPYTELRAFARAELARAEGGIQAELRLAGGELYSEKNGKVCWLLWAQEGLARSAGDRQQMLDVAEQLKRVGVWAHNGSVQFAVTQDALPCLEALQELKREGIAIGAAFQQVAEWIVHSTWDGGARPVCNGDGGVLVIPRSGSGAERCSDNAKYIADSAWFSWLLAKSNEGFSVRL